MKSKKLYCEKALFIKNISRTWFIPLIVFCFYMMLFVMKLNSMDGGQEKLADAIKALMGNLRYVFVFSGALLSILSFEYLHKWSSVSFFHALPTTRTKTFVTLTLSNAVLILASTAASAIASIILIKAKGFKIPDEAIAILLFMLLMQLFTSLVTAFCMVLGGNIVFSCIYSFILIFGGSVVYRVLQILSSDVFWESAVNTFYLPEWLWSLLCPGGLVPYDKYYQFGNELYIKPATVCISLLISSAVFFILGIVIYNHMKTDRLGKMSTVPALSFWVKLLGSALLTVMLNFFFFEFNTDFKFNETGRTAYIIITVAAVFIFYYIISVFETKNYLAIPKKDMMKLAAALCVIAALSFGYIRAAKEDILGFPEENSINSVLLTVTIPSDYPERGDMTAEEYEAVENEYRANSFVTAILTDKKDIDELKSIYNEYYEKVDGYKFQEFENLLLDDYPTFRKEIMTVTIYPIYTGENGKPWIDATIPATEPMVEKFKNLCISRWISHEEFAEYFAEYR